MAAEDFSIPGLSNYRPAEFKGFSPSLSQDELRAIQNDISAYNGGQGGTINVYYGGGKAKTTAPTRFIQGPVLFDADGLVAGKEYDLSDPFTVYKTLTSPKFTTEQKVAISEELKRIGWYGSSDISEQLQQGLGWGDQDEKAWAQLLNFANQNRVTVDVAIGYLSRLGGQTGGPSIRVSSDEDVMAYSRELFLQQLGRMPTKKELAEAASYIRSRERGAAASGQQVPQTGLVAKEFAQQADPSQRVAYGLGKAMSVAFEALGR